MGTPTNELVWYQNSGEYPTPTFSKQLIAPHSGLNTLIVLDLDNDSNLDILSADDTEILWYQNQNTTPLSFSTQTHDNIGINDMIGIDIDQDGDQDLIVAHHLQNQVLLYQNNDGVFSQRILDYYARYVSSLYSGDIDNDGDLDIVAGANNAIYWYDNDNNQFLKRAISINNTNITNIDGVDIDGDGDIDIIATSSSEYQSVDLANHAVLVFENKGNKRFAKRRLSNQVIFGAKALKAADIDNDQDIDIIAISSLDNHIRIFSGMPATRLTVISNGNGYIDVNYPGGLQYCEDTCDTNFISPTLISLQAYPDSGYQFANWQGACTGTANPISIQFTSAATCSANFIRAIDYQLRFRTQHSPERASTVTAQLLTNFNSAATLNISIIGGYYSINGQTATNGISQIVIRQVGNEFSAPRITATLLSAANYGQTATALFILGDLTTTLTAITQPPLNIQLTGDGTGTITSLPAGINCGTTCTANFNYNAPITLYAQPESGSRFAGFSGACGYQSPLTLSASITCSARFETGASNYAFSGVSNVIATNAPGVRAIYAVDLDQDGDLDILSAAQDNHRITWHQNTNGVFTPITIDNNALGAQAAYAQDIDSDGDIDILAASAWDDTIAWYQNNGNNQFSKKVITNQANNARAVYSADVDGDGNIDILSASAWDNTIAWYQNDGKQNFTPQIINRNQNTQGANDVRVDYLNDDQQLDVLSASLWSNQINWHQQSLGEFGRENIDDNAYLVNKIKPLDFDQDGDVDVIAAIGNANTLAWYQNTNGVFQKRIIDDNLAYPDDVSASDIDGDGDIDLLATSKQALAPTYTGNLSGIKITAIIPVTNKSLPKAIIRMPSPVAISMAMGY